MYFLTQMWWTKIVAYVLQIKTIEKTIESSEKKRLPKENQFSFCKINISFNQLLLCMIIVTTSYQVDLVTC